MTRLSFPPSGYKRWGTCTASPAATVGMKGDRTKDKDEGLIAHELQAFCITMEIDPISMIGETISVKDVGEEVVTGELAEYVSQSIRYLLDQVDPTWVKEVELKVDLDHVIPGQKGYADFMAYDFDKPFVIHMADLKYGRGVKEKAERNGELMLHALGVLNSLTKAKQGRVEKFILHIVQPRLGHFESWEISKKDLLGFADEVRQKVEEANDESKRKFVASVDGCRFCEKKKDCVKLKESIFAKAVLGKNAFGGIDLKDPDTLSDEELVEMWDWLDFISAWAKNIKEHMNKSALGGKQYPGMKLVEGTEGKREWKDEEKAVVILEEMGLQDFEIYNQSVRTAPQIEKQLGKKVFVEKLGELIKRDPAVPKLVKDSDPGVPLNQARAAEFDD